LGGREVCGCQGLIKVRGVHSYANGLELREVREGEEIF